MTDNDLLERIYAQMHQPIPTTAKAQPSTGFTNKQTTNDTAAPGSTQDTPYTPAPVHTEQLHSANLANSPRNDDIDPTTLIQAVIEHRQIHQLTQEQLATELGINVRTLRDWEQGRRQPKGPSQALLRLFITSARS
ncbi:helix-turn-helix domain-containing protein [Halorhodospira halochloris]|uniref:helix-turn-helix domain-containing protein n=1 Tax=Halorhodospira halochloris TaxID=1052 RepID=UPI001EE78941|nr:helix-turn-helix domain-containing protein [Halorhodospira halochloris]MCG5547525.1 helix-turn-helix domain-containing protein [Halorhodospira halochloris]